MRLKIDEDIKGKLKNPVMLAGWPGMGNVGATTIQYIRSDMGAKEFAHIDMSDELMPESIKVKDGLALHSDLPMTSFYYAENPDILFVESQSQLQGGSALSLMSGVLELAHQLEVSTIYTAAAFASPVSCAHEVEIYGVANDPVLRDRLVPMGANLLGNGQISGMNGVLLGFTNGYQIPAACLMATMPQYATSLHNPKSSRAIIKFFEKVLDFKVDMTGLDKRVKEMEQAMLEIEKRILQVISEMSDEETPSLPQQEISVQTRKEKKTPEKAMQKIEQLFQELAKEKSKEKASKLKEELDRWDLYSLYEDRFLDLFREDEESEG